MKKCIGLIGLLVVIVLVVAGCGRNGLEGSTWKYTYDAGSYYTFSFSNGTVVQTYVNIMTGEHETNTASYSVNGNKLTIDNQTVTWEIKGNTLVLSVGGEQTVFDRV